MSSTNSVLSNLVQTLSADSPTLSTVFSSPNVQTALQKASPADVVQLSDDAVKFEEASLLFGNADSTQTPSSESASDSILQSLQSSLASEANGATSSTTSSTSTAPDLASLFGTGSTTDPLLNTYI